jgi:Cu/Ag efflux protein CusF
MAVKLEPTANKSGIRERIESTQDMKAPAGGMPGIAEVRTVEVLAIVQSIDRKAKQATLRGAKRIITIDVPDNIDLSKVKVGDEVRAVFTEAAVVSVEPAAKKP